MPGGCRTGSDVSVRAGLSRRDRYLGDEFAGIDEFPFASTEVSLLVAHDRLIRLSEVLLGGDDLRIYSAEAWAKYQGAADYDQALHRDYLNHIVVVPSAAAEYRQLEMLVFLADVPEDLGPPHLLSKAQTAEPAAKPNWLPLRITDASDDAGDFVAPGSPHLYEREVSAAGP
ncbi:hypothetical protein, partial [Protofrankia coriariae]